MINDITVVIRSANERTISACKNLVLNEVNEENVFIIEEKPFSEAVIKTFDIGLKQGKKWTLAIDADLIIVPNAITQMVNRASINSTNLYVYQGYIIDKFRGGTKSGGPHLYLTENLKNAKKYYKEIKNEVRPESFLYSKMKKDGFNFVEESRLFALHDFFQFYEDIYRKAFFHGIKHFKWSSLFVYWLERGKLDYDFRIFIKGFIDGYYSDNKSYPDIDDLKAKTKEILKNNLKVIKGEFSGSITPEKIYNIVASHDVSINNELMIIKKKPSFANRIKNRILFFKK